MTSVRPISMDILYNDPDFLSKNKILYFDDFNNQELSKYKNYLDDKGIYKIMDLNKKVIYIANLINSAHNIYNYDEEIAKKNIS